MREHSLRRLRRVFLFLLRLLLLATIVTLLVRFLFDNPKPKHSKALVVASISGHADEREWLDSVPRDWTVHTYVTDKPLSPQLAVPVSKGREAMAYLTYIIDNYDTLPDVIFFRHDHSKAWHQSMTSLEEVTRLRSSFISLAGFASSRCLSNCENVIPLSKYRAEMSIFPQVGRDVHLTTLLEDFLETERGEIVPTKIAAPCCAQFAVSRDAIRSRSLEWWTKLRQWLIDVPLPDLESGRLFEWTWHIWFGQGAKYCPPMNECMCQVFGMGDCKGIWKRERNA